MTSVRATHTEFPSVVRLFELNCCAIPLTAAGDGGIVAVVRLDLGTQGGEVVVPLADGPSGVAHPPFSCEVVNIEIAADLEGQLDIISESSREGPSDSHQTDGYHISPSLVRTAAWGRDTAAWDEIQRSQRRLCTATLSSLEEEHASFKSPSSEGAGCEEGSEAPTTKRDRGPLSEASVPSRIPGNSARSRGRFRWQVGRPRSQRGTLLGASAGISRIRLPVKPVRVVPTKRRSASSPTSRPCRSTCSSGQAQKLTLSQGRVRSGSGRGNNGDGTHRSSQRRRVRRGRGPATD